MVCRANPYAGDPAPAVNREDHTKQRNIEQKSRGLRVRANESGLPTHAEHQTPDEIADHSEGSLDLCRSGAYFMIDDHNYCYFSYLRTELVAGTAIGFAARILLIIADQDIGDAVAGAIPCPSPDSRAAILIRA